MKKYTVVHRIYASEVFGSAAEQRIYDRDGLGISLVEFFDTDEFANLEQEIK